MNLFSGLFWTWNVCGIKPVLDMGPLVMYERNPEEAETLLHNERAWDRMAAGGHVLARPVRDDELAQPLRTVDAAGWLQGGIQGWSVLCLAAGGGRHGPLYAAAGARVTVVDLSSSMLELDRRVAEERRMQIRTVQTSMDDLSAFAPGEFDLVIHPVSTCYLPSLDRLFPEIARVIRPAGLYISQHKQPANLQVSLETHAGHYVVEHAYYDSSSVPRASKPSKLREPQTREFAHSWESILAGICRSGFVIEDALEPCHAKADAPTGSFHHRCYHVAPYIRIKARRRGSAERSTLLVS